MKHPELSPGQESAHHSPGDYRGVPPESGWELHRTALRERMRKWHPLCSAPLKQAHKGSSDAIVCRHGEGCPDVMMDPGSPC